MADQAKRLREQHFEGKPHKVDREAGIIHDVRILGSESRNGYRYAPQAIKEAATKYEGLGAYIDHSYSEEGGGERKFNDLFGRFENVRHTDTEARGDLHFLKSHALAERVCEAAERFPQNFGCSHEAYWGQRSSIGGETVIESISSVSSVDIVTSPATNNGLFESHRERPDMSTKTPVKTSIRKLLEAAGDKGKKTLKRLLEADPGMAGVAAPAMLDNTELESPAEDASPEDMMEQARNAQVVAILDDDSMDVPAKLAAIGAILTAHGDIQAAVGGDTGTTDTTPPADKAVAESLRKLQSENAKLKADALLRESQASARKLLVEAEVEPTDELVEAVALLPTEDKRKKLIESYPKAGTYGTLIGQRPDVSPPLRESTAVGNFSDEAKEFKKRYGIE